MQNIGGMHSLESTESLVDEILAMVIGEILSSDHAMHVRFHQFLYKVNCCRSKGYLSAHLNEIDLREALVISRLLNIEDGDDILMIEVS